MIEGPAIIRAKSKRLTQHVEQPGNVPMRHEHALRGSSGTGGVDDIKELFRIVRRFDIRVIPACSLVRMEYTAIGRPVEWLIGNHKSKICRINHPQGAFLWMFRVQGHVSTTGLEDAKDAHDQFR